MSKPQHVDSDIACSAREDRPVLRKLRKIIKSTLPKAEEEFSWNVPTYKYYGIRAGYVIYKNHVSSGVGADGLQNEDRKMLEDKGHTTGKKPNQSGSTSRCRPKLSSKFSKHK